MKDISSTTFGFIIAYLLPGLLGFISLTFWSPRIKFFFDAFLSANSNIGLFLIVLLIALTIGLIAGVIQWLIFEELIFKKLYSKGDSLKPSDFKALGTDNAKLLAFRAAVDENYRYYQFYGGTTVIAPLFFCGLLHSEWDNLKIYAIIAWCLCFLLFEIIIGRAAIVAYNRYVKRAKFIIKEE